VLAITLSAGFKSLKMATLDWPYNLRLQAESDIRALGVARPGEKSFGRFMALSELLESLLQRRVELVTTEALSPFIEPRILAEAQDVLRAA
jgi:hypothetical protein